MNSLLKLFIGNKLFQKPFEFLHILSLYGMNYGNSGHFDDNGEQNTIEYVKAKLNGEKQIIFFDVGANSGHYSQLLATIFAGKSYKLHAFEPSKPIFGSMEYMLAPNKDIVPRNFGLGEKKELVTLYADAEISGLASLYQRRLNHAHIDMTHKEEVSIDTIDNYCKENNIERINFLKMDIEGNEFKCLLGAKEMLAGKKIDFIQFEFGGANIDSRIFFQDFWYLLNENYNIYRIIRNGLIQIKSYKERFEIFKNINYLAERKSF